jgi:hypothetical protein
MAQFEREMMLERQREGIAKAKAQGKYKGRKPTARAKAEDAVRLFRQGEKVAHIASALGIGSGPRSDSWAGSPPRLRTIVAASNPYRSHSRPQAGAAPSRASDTRTG